MVFEDVIIYPDEVARDKYVGATKDGNICHGQGTLTMKSGKTYVGDWVDGQLASHADEIEKEEQAWDHAMIAKKDKQAIHAENKKLRVLQERLLMLKENIDTYPQYIEEAQAAGLLKLH